MPYLRPLLATSLAVLLLIQTASGCRAPAAAPAVPAAPALPTSATVGGNNIVAISPPAQQCCPKQTLPQWLGLTGLFKGIGGIIDRIRNRLGSIWPGLEAKPEVLAITDPANLESGNPAIASAAEIKGQEDEAAQKAKAIAYLASVGCAGCYPGVEEAMLAALDDCTELIRFETAKALRSTAAMPCKNCCRSACCGPKLRAKLEKLAYSTDSQGCYLESSDRVRRMARLALAQCTCVPDKPAAAQERLPQEGPGAEETPAPAPEPTPAVASVLRAPPAASPAPAPAAAAINSRPVGTGLSTPPMAAAPQRGAAVRTVSYEEAIATLADQRPASPPIATQVACEIWTARPGDFASRADAFAVMTLARSQLISSQPGQALPPQLQRAVSETVDRRVYGSPALAQAVDSTPVGGVSAIVEDQSGWHLVRVWSRRPVPAVAQVSFAQPQAAPPPAAQPPVNAGQGRIIAVRPANCDCR